MAKKESLGISVQIYQKEKKRKPCRKQTPTLEAQNDRLECSSRWWGQILEARFAQNLLKNYMDLFFFRKRSTYTDTNNPFNRVWIVLKINVWTLIWLISPRLHLQAEPTLLIWATCRRTENLHCWVFTLGWSTDTYDRSHYCVSGLSKKKRVDCNLNVFFVSIRDMHQCQWSFVIPSSPCFVIFIAMCKGKAQNFCPLLCSMYGDTTNLSEPLPMLVFLEHINKISLALQKKMCTNITETTFASRPDTFDMNNLPSCRKPSLLALYSRLVHHRHLWLKPLLRQKRYSNVPGGIDF